MVTSASSPANHLAHVSIFISLVVIVVLVPLVLYKIHIATSRLVMEGDNLRHWYLVNKMVENERSLEQRDNTSRVNQKMALMTDNRAREEEISNYTYSLACSPDQLIREAVQNILDLNAAQNNTESVSIPQRNLSQVSLPSHRMDNSTRCAMEKVFLTSMVNKVLHVSQVNCRRKKKLVKVWHTPKPEPLLTSKLPHLIDMVQNLIQDFDYRHNLYGNKEYADLLWQRLEAEVTSVINSSSPSSGQLLHHHTHHHHQTKLLFHVTVFNLRNRETDFAIRTNHKWKWELLRRTGDGESRAVVVLALPPPDQAARVDMDTLDCLQQEAKMSVCSGPLALPHCAAGAQAKVDRVWARCGSGARRGVGVICWGCGVWHRWSRHFPILHIQDQHSWNNIVWMDNSHS